MTRFAGRLDRVGLGTHLRRRHPGRAFGELQRTATQLFGDPEELLALLPIEVDAGDGGRYPPRGFRHGARDLHDHLHAAGALPAHVHRLGQTFVGKPLEPAHDLLEPIAVHGVLGRRRGVLEVLLVANLRRWRAPPKPEDQQACDG